jgi:hypothetical protein
LIIVLAAGVLAQWIWPKETKPPPILAPEP